MISALETVIAQKEFVINAPERRVWDLLGTVIYQSLPLEKVDIESGTSFNAVLIWRLGFLSFPFHVKGKLVNLSRPSSFGCMMSMKRGPIQIGVKVTFLLRAINAGKTEVVCSATQQGKSTIIGLILRNFVEKTFDLIGTRLQQITG